MPVAGSRGEGTCLALRAPCPRKGSGAAREVVLLRRGCLPAHGVPKGSHTAMPLQVVA